MVKKSACFIFIMNGEIEILYEHLGAQQCQISLSSLCLPGSVRVVNQQGNEVSDVETILNNLDSTVKPDLNFPNSKNNLIFNLREINISCGLCEFPKVVCNLKYLTVLNLSNNSLESLPKEMGNLCNLVVLKLSGNKLHCLPNSLKHVQQLNYLDISSNKFFEVPSVLYYSVTALKVLDLSCNEITTFNEAPGCLNKLTVLRMSNNLLKEIPLWIFHSICQLQILHLAENQLHFDTKLPNYCRTGVFESLQLLNIENCNLNSETIEILSVFKNLKVLQIGNKTILNDKYKKKNYMGNLKSNIFKNYRKIKYLSLQNAQIATLPLDFDCLMSLVMLDLSDNILSWLPECFCNLINLKIINLASNQLLFLPNNIDRLVNLKEIHLGNNKLSQVPESFYNLTNLEFVDLYNNQIEKINPNIFKENQLKGIDLGLNYINFDFLGYNVDEVRELYDCKKELFRKHFPNVGGRSDVQKVKSDRGFDEKSCDSHSHISSYETESLSDLEEFALNFDQNSYQEDENWEESAPSKSEGDELFDSSELIKCERDWEAWSVKLQDNYCPAKYHSSSVRKTYLRNFTHSLENETVEDGQFDSD